MPAISNIVKEGPLSVPERSVWTVIQRHSRNGYVWSTSLESLSELAMWAFKANVENPNPPNALYPAHLEDGKLDINSKIQMASPMQDSKNYTYTLRTIATALKALHESGRIWGFELYGIPHYGMEDVKGRIEAEVAKLPEKTREKANYKPELSINSRKMRKPRGGRGNPKPVLETAVET